MANWVSSGLPQDAAWTNCQETSNVDAGNPFLIAHDQVNAAESTSFCHTDGFPEFLNPWSSITTDGFAEGRGGASASRSHSEAEKRRRDRINAQLATLRKLIPKSDKMDKAALLGSVVQHVKDLKKQAAEINKITMIPSDTDEVTVDHVNDTHNNTSIMFLKASISCDDRPELFSELNRGLKSLRLTTVHADMMSLGGRVRSILLLHPQERVEDGGMICMNTLKQSLKVVLSRIATSCSTSNYRVKSRRQRFFFPSH